MPDSPSNSSPPERPSLGARLMSILSGTAASTPAKATEKQVTSSSRTAAQLQQPKGGRATTGTAAPQRPDGWRETVESIVVAFVLAFLFRTFEAEAFVIPTGSMAPTLYGQHRDVN